MMEKIQELNALGFATFPTKDKKPLCAWKDVEPTPFVDDTIYGEQYGVRLRPTDLVIDLDPRNWPPTRNIWKEFKEAHGLPGLELDTFLVKTGGGGLHVYLEKPADLDIKKTMSGFPGIDFLAGVRYVIGPGSKHESGKEYTIIRGKPSAIKKAPKKLLELIEKGKSSESEVLKNESARVSDDAQNCRRYVEYLEESAVPAVQGLSGDETTFKTACRGRDYGLSIDRTVELMLLHYNPKCVPPWHPDDLRAKVENAYRYNAEPAGKKTPEAVFEPVAGALTPLHYDYLAHEIFNHPNPQELVDLNATGKPKANLRNAVIYLTIKKCVNEFIQFNELSHGVEVTGDLPWANRRTGKNWSDADTTHLKFYFSSQYRVEFQTNTLLEAVYVVAARKSYHPVRKYLSDLKWDGQKRLDKWLVDYCGVSDGAYTRVVGAKTLIAAIARVFEPGCKFDHVLILEGKQRIGKSLTCKILGGQWFGDFQVDPSNKDTVDAMRGKWIIELPEMSVVRRKQDIEELKAFITRTEDRVRFAYARMTTDMPRQSIFIGTVNPDNVGYLVDRTGNGRFWPVLCEAIDLEGVERDRDQLLAEAVVRYRAGEKLFIEDVKLREEAEARADERVEDDPWITMIGDWNMGIGKDIQETSTTDIYTNVLNGMAKSITRFDQIRIGKALLGCGWYKHRTGRGNVYKRGEHVRFPDVGERQ